MFLKFIIGLAIALVAIQLFFFLKSLLFYKYLYPKRYKPRFQDSDAYPSVHLLVASKGLSNDSEKIFRAMANQKYPGEYKVTIVTESERDLGNPLLQSLANEYEHVHHLIAGLATQCSQKNHNLLAAMEGDHESDIFAFADADVMLGENWLTLLTRPLTQGKNIVSTGLPSHTLSQLTLSHLIHAALSAYQAKMVMSVGAIWGGSYAVWRETFDGLGTRQLWSQSVVDDIALHQLIQSNNLRHWWGEKHISLMPVPDLELEVSTSMTSVSKVIHWFIRQVLYIKYHRRPIWHLAVWGNFFNMLLFFAPLCLFFPNDPELFQVGLLGFSFVMFLWVINISLLLIRRQNDVTLFQWGRLFVFGDFVANVSLLATLFTNQLHWGNITYHVRKDGKVSKVVHPEDSVGLNPSEAIVPSPGRGPQ